MSTGFYPPLLPPSTDKLPADDSIPMAFNLAARTQTQFDAYNTIGLDRDKPFSFHQEFGDMDTVQEFLRPSKTITSPPY